MTSRRTKRIGMEQFFKNKSRLFFNFLLIKAVIHNPERTETGILGFSHKTRDFILIAQASTECKLSKLITKWK